MLLFSQTAHAEAEEASDSFADDFLNKRIDSVDEFLDSFLVSCSNSECFGDSNFYLNLYLTFTNRRKGENSAT